MERCILQNDRRPYRVSSSRYEGRGGGVTCITTPLQHAARDVDLESAFCVGEKKKYSHTLVRGAVASFSLLLLIPKDVARKHDVTILAERGWHIGGGGGGCFAFCGRCIPLGSTMSRCNSGYVGGAPGVESDVQSAATTAAAAALLVPHARTTPETRGNGCGSRLPGFAGPGRTQ